MATDKLGHRWGGAGYACLSCDAIKDTPAGQRKCKNPEKKLRKPKALPKGLPKGLEEFEQSLYDEKFANGLLRRLLDLPNAPVGNMTDVIERHRDMLGHARALAEQAREVRINAAKLADEMWLACVKNWTVRQLQEATGYDMED